MNTLYEHFPQRTPDDMTDVLPVLLDGLRRDPDRVVFAYEGAAVTTGQLRERIGAMQNWLATQGLRKGDHVAVMLTNSAEHITLIYAIVLSGLVWIPVNTRLRSAGLQYLFQHARPRLFVAEAEFSDALAEAGNEGVPCALITDTVAAMQPADIVAGTVTHADPLCIIYTSGTTGAPKGVVFTHRMMRIASEAVLRVADVQPGARLFVWEPLCHIGGAQMLMVPFLARAELHVVARFSVSRFWEQWTTARATHLHYLGGILDILTRTPVPSGVSIPVVWGAGIAAGHWQAIVDKLGCEIRECYGMTECSSFATLNTSGKPGSIGRALPWISVELRGDDDLPVGQGQIGEIVLSSDVEGVFLPRYLNNPEATSSTLRNGALHTGDSARQDAQGDYFFVGRRTDSMRVRGENVSAWEVERVFFEHPAIHSSAAVGVASDVGEQEIMLYVKFNEGHEVAWSELVEWARPKLATYQLPHYYRPIDVFELTPSERIRKHLLPRGIHGAWKRPH